MKGHTKTILLLINEKRDDIRLLKTYQKKFPDKYSEYEKSIKTLEAQIEVLQGKILET